MWIVSPSLESHYAPASACSTKESSSPSPEPALRVTLNGKLTLRPASWRGWKSRAWSQRLFGAIHSNPSLPTSLLDALTLSRRVSPVSPIPLPESAKVSPTNAGFGKPSRTSFAELGRDLSFWKTSGGSYLPQMEVPSQRFSGIWPASGSMSSGRCCELPKWVPRTNAPDSSSWPTARANDSEKRGRIAVNSRAGLVGAAQFWPTSRASDGTKGGPNQAGSAGDLMLPSAAAQWQTPGADSFRSRGGDRKNELGLDRQAQTLRARPTAQWQTPKASELNRGICPSELARRSLALQVQAETWATPTASANGNRTTKRAPSHGETHGEVLAGQAASWPTPAARDAKGANSEEHVTTNGSGRMHLDQLPNFVAHTFSHPGQNQNSGRTSSPPCPTSRQRLNPAFVCWLMGWPVWWTNPEPMPFAARATASWRFRLRRHLDILLKG